MMKVIFSEHALRKIEERDLDEIKIIETIKFPDYRESTRENRQLAEKNFGKLNLRVIFCREDSFIIIITAYWHERRKNENIL